MHRGRSLRQGALAGGLGFLFFAAILVLATAGASAQEGEEEGKAIFGQSCAVCHTLGRGTLVGPDLQGVAERREEAWLRIQIKSPSVHRAQNDPIAKANSDKFNIPMPDLGLTDQQVGAIIAYLKSAQPAPTTTPAQYIPTLAIGAVAIVGITLIGLIVGTKRVEVRP